MSASFGILRLSDFDKKQDALHLELARASIELGRKVLTDNPPPDRFADRKIYESVPNKTRESARKQPDGDREHIAVKERKRKLNRELERQHLSAADIHIAKAERVVLRQIVELEKLRGYGSDTTLAERTLKAFKTNLQALREHREAIIMTIEQIDRSP